MSVEVRRGVENDIPELLNCIKELALYEKAPDEVEMTEEQLLKDGFGERPLFHFFVAEEAGEIKGVALYYEKYSTWKGRCLFLEDLIVKKQYRHQGIGELLLNRLKKEAKDTGAKRLEWVVLDWNESAINFYLKQKASIDKEWLSCRVEF